MALSASERNVDATPLYQSPQELGNVLFALTQPNNNDLKKATLLIRKFLEKPESIMPLIEQIESSKHAEVRQVAAVYLREQIEEFYVKIPQDVKPKLKQFLLTKLVCMEQRAERLAIGAAISSLAKFAFTEDSKKDGAGWSELLVTLEKISKPSENVELREVAYILWRNLISYCGGAIKKHFGAILQILRIGLKDERSIRIQVESVKSIGIMVEYLENQQEVAAIEAFIPSMVAVIDKCLKKGDEENVISGMEVFNDLVESKIPVIHKHAEQLTKFNLKIAAAKDELPMTVRKQATNFATWLCKSKPKTVIQLGFIEPFLALCINLIIEDADKNNQDKENEAEDEDFLSPLSIACDLLDQMFLNIPSDQCFAVAMKAIQGLLSGSASAKQRRAGYVVMTMMAEGCKEVIVKNDNLDQLLTACLCGIADKQHSGVRKCALEAISQISAHCNFEILKYHAKLVPNLVKVFDNPAELNKVKERALAAIEYFIDAFDADNKDDVDVHGDFCIDTYLQDIMNVIGKCLESDSLELRRSAISALASCAQASRQKFIMYLPKVIQLLDSLLRPAADTGTTTDTADTDKLRGEATACLGSVAGAVGYKAFEAYLPKFHQYVMDSLSNIDHSDIREASFMYFNELAGIMGEDILKLPSFEEMLNFVLFVMEDDDGLIVELPDDGFGDAIPENLLKAEDKVAQELEKEQQSQLEQLTDEQIAQMMSDAIAAEEEDDDEDEEAEADEAEQVGGGQLKTIKLNVTTGFMEEKAAAVHALTAFVQHGGFGFLPFLNDVWERLTYLWEYPHCLVKMSVSSCFHQIFCLLVKDALKEQAGKSKEYPRDGSVAYNDHVSNWIDTVLPMYIDAIRQEEDRDALNVIVDFFIDEMKCLGAACMNSWMPQLLEAINLYLSEQCACQESSDPHNNDTKHIGTKHQWISDTMADLIATLAELYGDKFSNAILDRIFTNLIAFGRESRDPQDQAMVVGCIADCCSRLQVHWSNSSRSLLNRFADIVYPVALRVARAPDVNMRQNALYCIGATVRCCDETYNVKYSKQMLECINVYLCFPRDGDRAQQLVRDNAVSALAKMLITMPNHLPASQLMPVMLNALPLSADFSENQYVYTILSDFILKHPSLIKPHIAQVLTLLALALSDKNVPQPTTDKIAQTFVTICKDNSIKSIIQSKLPENAQNNVKRALQHIK